MKQEEDSIIDDDDDKMTITVQLGCLRTNTHSHAT